MHPLHSGIQLWRLRRILEYQHMKQKWLVISDNQSAMELSLNGGINEKVQGVLKNRKLVGEHIIDAEVLIGGERIDTQVMKALTVKKSNSLILKRSSVVFSPTHSISIDN